jgi:hypothetical protein
MSRDHSAAASLRFGLLTVFTIAASRRFIVEAHWRVRATFKLHYRRLPS